MNNELSSYFEDPEFKEILEKYEGMAEGHTPAYFDAEDLTDIAEYYASQNREAEAEAAIDFALQLHPTNTDALVFKARSLAIRGNLKEAYQVADLIEDPSDREVKFLKADLLMEEQRVEEAEQVYQELAETEEYSKDVLFDIALAYLDTNQKEYAAKWLQMLNDKGINETNSQRYRDVWCDYCMTFNEPEKAIRAYQISLDEHPYSINHWNGYAKCWMLQDNYAQAIEALEFAMAIDETNTESLEVKAYCLMQEARYPEAIDIYNKLLETAEDKTRIYPPLSKCYMDSEMADKAITVLKAWVKECPQITDFERSEIYSCIATCYCNLNLSAEGMDYIDAALCLNPFCRPSIIQKGMLYLQMQQISKAESMFRKALALTPDEEMVDTWYSIINCYYCLGRYTDVIKWCKPIFNNHPDDMLEALLLTAGAYYYKNEMKQCVRHVVEAWDIDRNGEDPVWKDYRFTTMLQDVRAVILAPDFDPENYSKL